MRGALERRDAVVLALVGDVDVDLRRAHVDVPGELADDLQRDAALGEHRAERVPERVRGAAVLANAGAGGVLGDDVADRARRDRLRLRGAALAQADEQRVARRRRRDGVPPAQRVVRLGVQRHGSRAAALGRAHHDLKPGLLGAPGRDRGAPARVGLAAALLDVGERQPRELGATQSRAREELEDRAIADTDRRAPVGLAQQPLELDVGQRARLVALDVACSAPAARAGRRRASRPGGGPR